MLSKYCFYDVDDDVLTDFVVCLILKISMNVTLVTTPVQQHKYVSISREALHAWILYSVTLLTSKLVTSKCVILWIRLHFNTANTKLRSPELKLTPSPPSPVSVCVLLRTLPAGTNPSLFCTDTWTCRRGAVCLQTSSRCRPPLATPVPSTSSR